VAYVTRHGVVPVLLVLCSACIDDGALAPDAAVRDRSDDGGTLRADASPSAPDPDGGTRFSDGGGRNPPNDAGCMVDVTPDAQVGTGCCDASSSAPDAASVPDADVSDGGFVVDSGDSAPPGVDSTCENVACSGNGECEIVAGAPVCVCHEGFDAYGLHCLAENPCDGVQCDGWGSMCLVVEGLAHCQCVSGWAPTARGDGCEPVLDCGDGYEQSCPNGLTYMNCRLGDDYRWVFSDGTVSRFWDWRACFAGTPCEFDPSICVD
jgi:hypothetical protein